MTASLPKISLIIITKNRDADLRACYESLQKMVAYPDEFILVDSSTNNLSKILTQQFSKSVSFPIRYIYEPRRGFPIARNRGLQTAKHNWIAFTDDDCVIDINFIRVMKRAIKKHPDAAAIAGESFSFQKTNLVSHVTTINENFWKSSVRIGDTISDLETLDNKNVVYNMSFFKSNSIRYDESRASFDGASDDCDLGMQIQQARGRGYYEKNMIVYHKNITNFYLYTKHLWQRTAAHKTYENKWGSYRNSVGLNEKKRPRLKPFVTNYIKSNNVSLLTGLALYALLAYTIILVKIIKKIIYRAL